MSQSSTLEPEANQSELRGAASTDSLFRVNLLSGEILLNHRCSSNM